MNSKKTIAIVAGTRPEAIKMAPVYFALKQSAIFEPLFLATAQHRQMLDATLGAFGITPEHDLNLMQPGQSLTSLTSRVLVSVGEWCERFRPAAMLVQGDTTTVLGASMAAFYQHVPVGHIEAGLRTHNMQSPFPEEMNRRLTSPLASWHFCPTEASKQNLVRESIVEHVYVTGNTVIDALLWMRNHLKIAGTSSKEVAQRCGISESFRSTYLDNPSKRWLLMTGHRRESFGAGFDGICQGILAITKQFPDVGILYPVHLNPKVRETIYQMLGNNAQVELVEPASYVDFVWLMDHCYFILSDSGGVQEEAPSLGKPVLVLRDTTERPEGVQAGTCLLVGTSPENIFHQAAKLLSDTNAYQQRSNLANPYGDGTASQQILTILEQVLKSS